MASQACQNYYCDITTGMTSYYIFLLQYYEDVISHLYAVLLRLALHNRNDVILHLLLQYYEDVISHLYAVLLRLALHNRNDVILHLLLQYYEYVI